MGGICKWCGCAGCDPTTAFHTLLRRHNLHSRGWSEIRDGWLVLVDNLVVDLYEMGWSGNIAQIKEKFGALCFYAEDTDAAMERLIGRAAEQSRRTCEVCGAPGQLGSVPGSAWQRTRCAEHAREPPPALIGHTLPGWYSGQAQGVRPLAPALRLVLAELQVESETPTAVAAPSAVLTLLPETTKLLVLEAVEPLADALAANLIGAWLAQRYRATPFVACGSRRSLAQRLVAAAANVPLEKITHGTVDANQRAAIRAATGDLVSTAIVVDDAARDVDQVIAHVRGVAALNEVGLIIVAGLGRRLPIPAPRPSTVPDDEAGEDAIGNVLARLVFLAEDLDCVLVVLTADHNVARLAAADSSLSMGVTALKVQEKGGALAIGDLRLRLLASGRLVAAS